MTNGITFLYICRINHNANIKFTKMLSELRQLLRERINVEYRGMIRKGYRKAIVLDALSRKHCVSIAWIRQHCDLKDADLDAGVEFDIIVPEIATDF